jgi:glycosyltransferase involved in cell wall biosynthesis
MPRVLHVISGLQVGGAEMALLKLVVSSRGGPFEHSVVALAPEGDMRQRFLAAGVELTVLDFRRAPLAGFWRLHALIRQSRPEIIQTWMYHADLIGGLAARLAGRREVIWGIRTTSLQRVGATGTAIVRKLCALLSRLVPHTIVCVAEAARKAHAAVGYDARRMVVVPNGFTLGDNGGQQKNREAVRAACGFGPDTVVIGTIGRFSEDKDPENFVRAAGALGKRHDNLRFMMVGRSVDAGNAELARWIAATGCAERFVLLGERRDVGACLAAMDVFCLSSRTEGFPNVVGEAMALGVPCVVTDVGDAALLVGETGMVVPAEDPESLAKALDRMVDLSPPERRDLGGKALDRIEQHFTIERARARFEAIYKRIVEKGIS